MLYPLYGFHLSCECEFYTDDRTAVSKTPTLLKEEWISVLKLASLWQFLEIRDLAVKELAGHAQSLDSIERILLGKQYDVSAWLRSGYTDLARRDTSISLEEAKKIGWEATLMIFQSREASMKTNYYAGRSQYEHVDVETPFREVFKAADDASAVYKRVDPNPPVAP